MEWVGESRIKDFGFSLDEYNWLLCKNRILSNFEVGLRNDKKLGGDGACL